MENAEYAKTALAMLSTKGRLIMWEVGKGVLIVNYSETKSSINSMSFWHSDERSKFERKTFSYQILSFDPATGDMKIQTKTR